MTTEWNGLELIPNSDVGMVTRLKECYRRCVTGIPGTQNLRERLVRFAEAPTGCSVCDRRDDLDAWSPKGSKQRGK